jgi:hypothetical protein
MFIANVVLNTPAIIFLSLVLIPFLVIEILGATAPQPEGENHKIAHTLSECMQRITYHAKTARAIPVSWAALAVFGVAGLLAWKTAWVILTLSLFGNSADTVSAVIIGITIFLWNAPHWWDPRNFG